jgi:hypothetical protein
VTDRSFFQFLTESLGILRTECRPAYARIAQSIGALELAIEVDGHPLSVISDHQELTVLAHPRTPRVSAQTSKRALIALLEAECTLLDSVWTEQVRLLGSLQDLLAFHDALTTYFNGAVRCPSFPALLARFLGSPKQRQQASSLPSEELSTITRGVSS